MHFLDYVFYGNTVRSWGTAAVVFGAGFLILKLLRRISLHRISAVATQTDTMIDDLLAELLEATKSFFLFAVALYASTLLLKLPDRTQELVGKGIMLLTLVQAGIWGTRAIEFWIERHLKKRAAADSAIATTMGLLSFMAKLALFILIFLLALNNLGINITALVAGLGVGGIAIALAVQNILGDLFASATIVLDKPFVVGDAVAVGEFIGTIEHIGLKTTRVRSLSGEQLIFPNSDLLQSRIRNFKRMQERRVVFVLGLVYDTKPEALERVPMMIQEIVERHEKVRFERCHFMAFGPSSLNVETVYWVTDADHPLHMNIQQSVFLQIMKRFAAEGLEFAFPTQTLHVANMPQGASDKALS